MRQVAINVYKFSELSDKAKEKAKNVYRENTDSYNGEYFYSLKKLAEHFNSKLNVTYNRYEFDTPEMEDADIQAKMNELGTFNPDTLQGHGECVLTGCSTDEDAIDGFRRAWHKGERDLERLLDAASNSAMESAESEYEALFEDETFAEHCDANNYEFLDDGVISRHE